MKLQYLGTAAAEGIPAVFCECENCIKSKENGGRNIRTRSQALIDDCILIDFPQDTYNKKLSYNSFTPGPFISSGNGNEKKRFFSYNRQISVDIFFR